MALLDTIIREPECLTCKVLREMLDKEIEEKRYLQQVILSSSGFVKGSQEEIEERVAEFKPLPSRFTSLSLMRKQAARC